MRLACATRSSRTTCGAPRGLVRLGTRDMSQLPGISRKNLPDPAQQAPDMADDSAAKALRKQEKRAKKAAKAAAAAEAAVAADAPAAVAESEPKKAKKDKKEKKDKKDKSKKRAADDDAVEAAAEPATEPKKAKKASAAGSASPAEVEAFLKENTLTVTDPRGGKPLNPFLEFGQAAGELDDKIYGLVSGKYPKPTPIQSASWPHLLAGRDLIGVAETGSGKTMSFGVPAVQHIVGLGAAGRKKVAVVVVSPTRELALQIQENVEALCEATGIKSVCLYGGVSKDDQKRAAKGASVVVATPGRLLDLLEEGAVSIASASYVVLDEADRMLEKGFEEDIKKIIGATSPSRQMVMFTATWPQSIQNLAASFLKEPVKVMVGDRDGDLKANTRIEQIVEVMDPFKKEQRLLQVIKEQQARGRNDRILIFALYKKEASRVERTLTQRGLAVAAIHGDLTQAQRTHALEQFKSGKCTLLLATDVASRGLDIPAVKLVINLTFPLTAEDYVHRIGRTGRAGQTGKAITFFTEHEKHLSGALINVLRSADQPVPEDLLKFGGHTKKKEHSVYGAFYKDVDPTKKAKKIVFD
ncbi:ATP-dependent RNA helicase DBP3 [Dipodascopsis tothii]|uniref:ATP-dependent RNA helicase DBP3 n=1 Tax=Dipodascopsis tothii TaxID=44089 RepID=UPI0034CE38A6